jgi:hypothetical protein
MLRAVGGLGVVWTDQLDPFHCSASVTLAPEVLVEDPTATQLVTVAHDTAVSEAVVAPLGVAGVWAVHVAPFHCSATGDPFKLPTAIHELTLGQDTPASRPLPTGDWIVQAVPFHCPASSDPSALPTARHTVAVGQETLVRRLVLEPVGIGSGTIVQFAPVDSSVKATSRVKYAYPTAMHALVPGQETLESTLLSPVGLAVDWSVQTPEFEPSANAKSGGGLP